MTRLDIATRDTLSSAIVSSPEPASTRSTSIPDA